MELLLPVIVLAWVAFAMFLVWRSNSLRLQRRDYLRKSADDQWLARQRMMERATPQPDWFPGEEEKADAWSLSADAWQRPPGHEMYRCVIEKKPDWITFPDGRSYTLTEIQAMREQRLQPINSAAWTGRE